MSAADAGGAWRLRREGAPQLLPRGPAGLAPGAGQEEARRAPAPARRRWAPRPGRRI